MNGQHCFGFIGFFLVMKWDFYPSHAIAISLFLLLWKCYFFIVIINGFNAQSPAPGLYSSRCAKDIPKRSRLNLNSSMITFITEKALRYLLSHLLYEKSGGTILKPSTWRDQSSTSSPLSSICLNAPLYCFDHVIRPRNSIIILYLFSSLAPFRGSVKREVGRV